jgi:hypothetical protein
MPPQKPMKLLSPHCPSLWFGLQSSAIPVPTEMTKVAIDAPRVISVVVSTDFRMESSRLLMLGSFTRS